MPSRGKETPANDAHSPFVCMFWVREEVIDDTVSGVYHIHRQEFAVFGSWDVPLLLFSLADVHTRVHDNRKKKRRNMPLIISAVELYNTAEGGASTFGLTTEDTLERFPGS